jgi:hypothetical protein
MSTTIKPNQIVARYDGSLVALTATGELFGQVKGGWEKIDGPEGEKLVAICAKPNGPLVAITTSGKILEQFRAGDRVGDYSAAWRPVPSIPDQEKPQ